MFNLKSMLSCPYGYYDYIWVDVLLVHETCKAILIAFDGKKAWLPKAWILRIKKYRNCKTSKAASIKISLYHWSKKFT
jgi:hypothetical protein